jgi:hypothetical protein
VRIQANGIATVGVSSSGGKKALGGGASATNAGASVHKRAHRPWDWLGGSVPNDCSSCVLTVYAWVICGNNVTS